MSAFFSAGCFILVDPSIVAKRLHISPYINRVLEYFQNKDKMAKFHPPCLPRKTKFLYLRAEWFVQVSGRVAISITLYN
jgi:hypothetical protein